MKKVSHPYTAQPDRAHWKKAIFNVFSLDIKDWYRKKFDISKSKIATGGSCFAQHIGRQLRERGFGYVDTEPPPKLLSPDQWMNHGFEIYSARYGNLYTPRQLLQLLTRSHGRFRPKEDTWKKGDGFVDPFRPTIEPDPFPSVEELRLVRSYHFACVRKLVRQADVFVFTLGLTEAWESIVDGAIFPIAPGVSGGEFDKAKHQLVNFNYDDVVSDMEKVFYFARKINPTLKFILTVSPVPLMATATDEHVVVATTYSKSVLRAACGHLESKYDFVDYFPSFEIVSSHVMRAQFFEPDMRGVSMFGVNHVMSHFFAEHPAPRSVQQQQYEAGKTSSHPLVCDEELLAVFGSKS